MQRKFIIIGAILWTLFLSVQTIYAEEQDYTSSYLVHYELQDNGTNVLSRAKYQIAITNLKDDVYVRKFSLAFPLSFKISNIIANDVNGRIEPKLSSDQENTIITLEFNNPNYGMSTRNTLNLEFDQDNLFKVNGNIWEVMLPIIDSKAITDYTVAVLLPGTTEKKISISKPIPDKIDDREIVWKNPKTKTIYAIFGDSQYYNMNLSYTLKNSENSSFYTDIAFPPDTTYQKIFLDSVNPKPIKILRDTDGNYLGRYLLKANELKKIDVNMKTIVFSRPREDVVPAIRDQFFVQKKYLLNRNTYWNINIGEKKNKTQSIEDIFAYTYNTLSYNYNRASTNTKRLGAIMALQNPNSAVCIEYSDVFVSTARNAGFYAREIQGFGFSNDSKLQPISLTSDVLHSWSEYYDIKNQIWVPVDPTWQDTSGIDYFSSFDLNHITFAIHGEESDYPYPAGSYKAKIDTKQVQIVAISTKPVEKFTLDVQDTQQQGLLFSRTQYTKQFKITNTGNSFLWNVPILITADGLEFDNYKKIISVLAPMEEMILPITFIPADSVKKTDIELTLKVKDTLFYSSVISVYPHYYLTGVIISLIVFCLALLLYIIKVIKRNYSKKRNR
ncbi:MAG: transglutaminase domain-containing protein [Candidatus Roizmanbacteria bacterium]